MLTTINGRNGRKGRTLRITNKHLAFKLVLPKDKCCLISVIEDYGNPFKEGADLLVLYSKEIADDAAVDTIWNAHLKQFQTFTKECIVDRVKSIDDTIHRHRLKQGEATGSLIEV